MLSKINGQVNYVDIGRDSITLPRTFNIDKKKLRRNFDSILNFKCDAMLLFLSVSRVLGRLRKLWKYLLYLNI